MIANYIKLAFRNFRRNKGFTILNIAGLAVGLACAMVALLFILNETSYDSFHENRNRIYRVLTNDSGFGYIFGNTPLVLGSELVDRCPEIQSVARLTTLPGLITSDNTSQFTALQAIDPSFFDMFTLPLKEGTLDEFVKNPQAIVITERLARLLFASDKAVGRTVTADLRGEKLLLTIVAVLEDIPAQSSMRLQCLVPLDIGIKNIERLYGSYGAEVVQSWTTELVQTFILMQPSADRQTISGQLKKIASTHIPEDFKKTYSLQPMADFHLHSQHIANHGMRMGNIDNLYIFGIIAGLILLLAAANYTILSTAQSFSRYREVGLRKVVGADRKHIMIQFLCDAVITALLSLPLALLMLELMLPAFNEFVGMSLTFSYVRDWIFLVLALLLTSIVGMSAGSYVAFILSSLRPIEILRGATGSGGNKYLFRRALVIGQIVIFVTLVGCTGVVYKQLHYILNYDFGYDKSFLMTAQIDENDAKDFSVIKSELLKCPGILKVTGASYLPPTESKSMIQIPIESDPATMINTELLLGDIDLATTLPLRIIEGRNFSDSLDPPGSNTALINGTAVRDLGLANPVGKQIGGYHIIGIVEDFDIHALREPVGPVIISRTSKYIHEVLVRMSPDNLPETVAALNSAWKQLQPQSGAEFQFFDQTLELIYQRERKMGSVFTYATLLAIFIACLGLIGLSAFMARQRKKEFGIRRVLGASIIHIIGLQMGEFLAMALIGGLIAGPIVYFVMQRWLEGFVYHVEVDLMIPLAGLLLGMFIAAGIVSIQSIRAAIANPVDTLKYE